MAGAGYGQWGRKFSYRKLVNPNAVGALTAGSSASIALPIADLPSPNPGRTYDTNSYARNLPAGHHNDQVLLSKSPSIEFTCPFYAKAAVDFLVSLFQGATVGAVGVLYQKKFLISQTNKKFARGDTVAASELPHLVDIFGIQDQVAAADYELTSCLVNRIRITKEGGLLRMTVGLLGMDLTFTSFDYSGTASINWNDAANTNWISNLYGRFAGGAAEAVRGFDLTIENGASLDQYLNDTPQHGIIGVPGWNVNCRVSLPLDRALAANVWANFNSRTVIDFQAFGPLTTSHQDATETEGDFSARIKGRIDSPTFLQIANGQIDTSFTIVGNYASGQEPIELLVVDNVTKTWVP